MLPFFFKDLSVCSCVEAAIEYLAQRQAPVGNNGASKGGIMDRTFGQPSRETKPTNSVRHGSRLATIAALSARPRERGTFYL